MNSDQTPFDLGTYLLREREGVEEARRRLGEHYLSEIPKELGEPIQYALDAGGKRLRPIISVAAYRAALPLSGRSARSVSGIYDLAVALEFIHTYSLIHDDLPSMDDDDLRRGRPTTHRVYGVRRATLAGAALIPLATLALVDASARLQLGPEVEGALVRTLCRAAGAAGMVGGQWLDLEAEGQSIDLETLEGVHRRKTGALLGAAALLGGLAAEADDEVLRALEEYGDALGLAFQIADDILDLTGDQERLGKTAGRDLSLGKATYPAIMGLSEAYERARLESERAVSALRRVGLASPALIALARHIVEREH